MLVTQISGRKVPRHPTDSLGLALPEPSWPDPPGSAHDLESVRRFCNSTNREAGADAWRSAAELDSWLQREGYVLPLATPGDVDRARQLRDAIWRCVRQHSLAPLTEQLTGVRASMSVDATGALVVHGAGRVSDQLAISLAMTMRDADRDGTWTRLKACDHCGWVFHDTSKNRSGRWCSMQACGGREKAKAYRRRRTTPQE